MNAQDWGPWVAVLFFGFFSTQHRCTTSVSYVSGMPMMLQKWICPVRLNMNKSILGLSISVSLSRLNPNTSALIVCTSCIGFDFLESGPTSYIGARLRSSDCCRPSRLLLLPCVTTTTVFPPPPKKKLKINHCLVLPVKKHPFIPHCNTPNQQHSGRIYCFAYSYIAYSHCVIAVSETAVLCEFFPPSSCADRSGTGCRCKCDCECIC